MPEAPPQSKTEAPPSAAEVLDFDEKRRILAEIARNTEAKDADRIRAIWTDSRLQGEAAGLGREMKEFNGRTPEELKYYAEHGYFPERAKESCAVHPEGGGPPPGRAH